MDLQARVQHLDDAHQKGGVRVGNTDLVLWHCTAGDRADDAMSWLNRAHPDCPASYHYIVDKAGAILRTVPPELIAFHAGDSAWPVRTAGPKQGASVNKESIGVSFANDDGTDDNPDDDALTVEQLTSGLYLARVLSTRYAIPPSAHVAHREVAPLRKVDPLPGILPMTWWREQIASVLGATVGAP